MISPHRLSSVPAHVHVLMYTSDWNAAEESMTESQTIIHEINKNIKRSSTESKETLEDIAENTIHRPLEETMKENTSKLAHELKDLKTRVNDLTGKMSKLDQLEEKIDRLILLVGLK